MLIYPNEKKVFYEYDEFSRLTRLVDGTQEIKYNYNEDGHLCEKILPNSITSRYKYIDSGLLSKLVHQKNGEILEQYDYEYDQMRNKIGIRKMRQDALMKTDAVAEVGYQIQEENGYFQYQYDSLNRLIEVRKNRESLRRYEYEIGRAHV